MIDGGSVYTSQNIELHREISRKVPDLVLNMNLIHEFPVALEETFGITSIESIINRDSVPKGTVNNELTVIFRLLLKMVATCEYGKSQNIQDQHLARLQELSEIIKVIDTEKIELESNIEGLRIKSFLYTLFLENNLYLTDIRDSERLLSRIQKYAIKTILMGHKNDTIIFAKELIADGLDIDGMQESFFKLGFSCDQIQDFLKAMRIKEGLQYEKQKSDTFEDEGAKDDVAKEKKDAKGESKREKERDQIFPQPVNPFDYVVEEIGMSESFDGKGKEIGFRKRTNVKGKKRGGVPAPPVASNLGIEKTGIEFVKMSCRELFDIKKDDDIRDVHGDLKAYDILLFPDGQRKYVGVKASLSDPVAGLSRDQFEKAGKERENYYLFLVGNLQDKLGNVYVRYIQNPASHKHVRLGGARLKEINWKGWGTVKFGKVAHRCRSKGMTIKG